MNELPLDFVDRVTSVHGREGRSWLAELPARIDRIASIWDVEVQEPFPELHYHYVAAAVQTDGLEVVLKLGLPGGDIDREAACLRSYRGHGAPRLLAHEPHLGALLMERVQPGHDLTALDEEQAIAVLCRLMRVLHRRPEDSGLFPTVADWGRGFDRLRKSCGGGTGPLPDALVSEAHARFLELEASMAAPVLLHGDLHHGNVLAAGDQGWLAIDPQGVIGEPAYELGAFLRNPTPEIAGRADLSAVLANRVALFSEALAIDRQRAAGWGFAQAVLSAIWSLEDEGEGWQPAIAVANALWKLIV